MSLPQTSKQKTTAKVEQRADGLYIITSLQTTAPGTWPLEIHKGKAWSQSFIWIDESKEVVDLSGGSAACTLVVKEHVDDSTSLISLSGGSGITLAAAAPNIVIARTQVVVDAYDFTQAVYTLTATDGTQTVQVKGFVNLRR